MEEATSSPYAVVSHEIPFYLQGSPKWVSGITRITTCSDVLNSLVTAAKGSDASGGSISTSGYVLVEQWRGVERPLSQSSRILKLWLAWGDERQHVKFIVKRIRQRSKKEKDDSSLHSSSSSRHRRWHRSRQCNLVSTNASDTMHPRKIMAVAKLSALQGDQPSRSQSQSQLEEMMKELMLQGRHICQEITKLEANTSKNGTGEHSFSTSGLDNSDEFTEEKDLIKAELQKTQCVATELVKLLAINEELHRVETRQHLLDSNVRSLLMTSPSSNLPKQSLEVANYDEEETETMLELSALRSANESSTEVIAHNADMLEALQIQLDAARDSVKKLEYDVNVVEKEGRKLNNQLGRVRELHIPTDPTELLLDHQFRQRPTEEIYSELKLLQREVAAREASLHAAADPSSTSSTDMTHLAATSVTTTRITANVSPEGSSSSSGASSGGESCQIQEHMLSKKGPKILMSNSKKLAAAATEGDAADVDTNSDTGLSSLHSSGEEDALVAFINAPCTYDGGTLV